jgi:hypothetical protein
MRKLFGMMLLVAGSSAVALAQSQGVPEIDPASAASAVALISGGLLLISTRRKK